jgi:hypothetical protein
MDDATARGGVEEKEGTRLVVGGPEGELVVVAKKVSKPTSGIKAS